MTECLLTCRSMTYAQRAARALERAGLRGYVTKLKNAFSQEGCTYGVLTLEKTLPSAMELLRGAELAPKKVYRALDNDEYEELRL